MALSLSGIDIVIISLPSRSDRRAVITSALSREGLTYRIFDAVHAPSERPKLWKLSLELWGCRESHITVLEKANSPTLVLEDDADIPIGFSSKLTQMLRELPEEWAVLRLGGAHVRPPEAFSENLVRSRGALYPHAYLVRNPLESVAGARKFNIDWGTFFMLRDRRNHQTYAADPWLVSTTGSLSDIPDSIPISERHDKHLANYTTNIKTTKIHKIHVT
jgi:GR25 family glycosyltransferase involved in LPS biosynthesis